MKLAPTPASESIARSISRHKTFVVPSHIARTWDCPKRLKEERRKTNKNERTKRKGKDYEGLVFSVWVSNLLSVKAESRGLK